ncbi:MAG: DJ-1/PfpI family protein [Sphingomonas sp.]
MSIDRRALLANAGILAGAGALGSAAKSRAPASATGGLPVADDASGREDVAMLVYPGLTMLDIMGPYHFLGFLLNKARLHFVTNQPDLRPIKSDAGFVLQPTITMADCPRDLTLLVVPGGGGSSGVLAAAQDPATIAFVRDRASRAKYVSSICSGSLILGTAGLLRGRKATSHWTVVDNLAQFGAEPVRQRVVEDGNLITAAGVSAGLDLGLTLIDRLRGRHFAEVALLITEYAPKPPFSGGNLETARPEIVDEVRHGRVGYLKEVDALRVL